MSYSWQLGELNCFESRLIAEVQLTKAKRTAILIGLDIDSILSNRVIYRNHKEKFGEVRHAPRLPGEFG